MSEAMPAGESAAAECFGKYRGMTGNTLVAGMPLERDTLRRFVQAIMDTDPLYVDAVYAAATKYGGIVAPPLYPVHAFRPPIGGADPLAALQADPDADGAGGNDGVYFGLTPIESPFKRLLNGGNEIEFFRCLAVGERAVAKPRYASVDLKQTRNGPMLVVVIETRWETEKGELLMINRQVSLRR